MNVILIKKCMHHFRWILKKYAPSVYKWAINENEENKLNTIRNNFFPMHNAPIKEIQKCEEELSKIYP